MIFIILLVSFFVMVATCESYFQLKKYRKKCTEEQFSFYEQLSSTIEASWECRDCMVLSEKEYFKKRR